MKTSLIRDWLHKRRAAENAQRMADYGTSREPGISDQERRVRIIIEWQNRAWLATPERHPLLRPSAY